MKKINIPLVLGSFILLAILILMLFPEWITSKSPYTLQHMRFSTENNQLVVESAPYPPSSEFIFGSDDLGRDIYTYMVYGTRLTILLGVFMALGQFLVAIPMAIMGGFGHKIIKSMILQGNVIFSAIPALLISIIILQLDFFVSLNKEYSMLAFVLVITFVGWPKLGKLLMERVETINRQPFIRGEVAIGKRRSRIALENVIPHLVPEMIVLFFMEIARNLSMMMQLGIFGVFIGNLKIIKDSSMGQLSYYNVSFEPEWASMLSTSRNMLGVAPWTVFFPALAFFITVLGFNMFGEGLRSYIQKKSSRPLINIKAYKQWIGLMVFLVILGQVLDTNTYAFDYKNQTVQGQEQLMVGTGEAQDMALTIENKMKDLGIVPIEDETYRQSYDIGNVYQRLSQTMQVDTGQEAIQMKAGTDFSIMAFSKAMVEGSVYDASRQDLYNIKDFKRFKDQFILIDQSYYNEASIEYFIKTIAEEVPVKGFLLVNNHSGQFEEVLIEKRQEGNIVLISKELAQTLRENENIVVHLTCTTKEIKGQGANIMGFFEGEDTYLKDEVIAIGLGYNYLDEAGQDVLEFNLELMERLCQLEGNKRSMMFFFLDATLSDDYHGIYSLVDDFPYSPQKVKVYVDLTRIRESSFDTLEFSLEQAPITRQFAWSLGHLLEERILEEKMEVQSLPTEKVDTEYYFTNAQAANQMFWKRGIASIIIGTKNEGPRQLNELGQIILEAVNKNNY